MVYPITVAGLRRDLPLCKLNDSPAHRGLRHLRGRGAYLRLRRRASEKSPGFRLPRRAGGQGDPPHPRNGAPERPERVLSRAERAEALHERRFRGHGTFHHDGRHAKALHGRRRRRKNEGQTHPDRRTTSSRRASPSVPWRSLWNRPAATSSGVWRSWPRATLFRAPISST